METIRKKHSPILLPFQQEQNILLLNGHYSSLLLSFNSNLSSSIPKHGIGSHVVGVEFKVIELILLSNQRINKNILKEQFNYESQK